MKVINVILSGGVGSRLWPLSRKSRPKQYIPLFDNKSLFQKTAARNLSFCDEILVVGNKDNYLLSRSELKQLNITDFEEIIEAYPRNTAAAIAFAAFSADDEDILFVTPSDHLINNEIAYKKSVERAINLAKAGYLVTFGIKPTRVETGFGYIEYLGETAVSFREKPDFTTASTFLDVGNFLWNSGMFCFKANVFLLELKKNCPEVYEASYQTYEARKDNQLPEKESLTIPSISVDFAIMEKTKKIKVVKSDFEWSDMGSFEAIYNYLMAFGHPIDESGNMVIGTDIHCEFVGLKDTIFIYTSDALMLLQKDESQQVKKVFEKLEIQKPELVK